jgi:hypothetical protein
MLLKLKAALARGLVLADRCSDRLYQHLCQRSRSRVAPGNGETVIIVDDERALLEWAEETLAELGYEPVGFDSSAAALAAFRSHCYR